MHRVLRDLGAPLLLSGDLADDARLFLTRRGCPKTAEHCGRVAAEARRLAQRANADGDAVWAAGWLHDISAVIPGGQRAEAARALGIPLLPEEEVYPPIIHQKLSVVLAREMFGVSSEAVLSAIGCHTTLRPGATLLDKLVFLADKLEWDQQDAAPYRQELLAGLQNSVDHAVVVYLTWMHGQKLQVVHPWLRAAYEELTGKAWD